MLLRSVRLMNAPPGICLRGTVAYRARGRPDLPGTGQAIVGSPGTWDPKYCGQPQLVTAATLPAHASTSWIVTIGFTVSLPGTFHLDRAKITYAAGSVSGWQDEDLGLTIRYSAPQSHSAVRRAAASGCSAVSSTGGLKTLLATGQMPSATPDYLAR